MKFHQLCKVATQSDILELKAKGDSTRKQLVAISDVSKYLGEPVDT